MLSGIFRPTKSTKDLSGLLREYPPDAAAYDLLEDCGKGVSATVYRAYCKPLEEVVAIKKMNLDGSSNLDEIVHEAQLMKNYHHPNVLPLHTSFVNGSDLWMVMPFISGGSVLHIMKYAHPEGLEEVVIATIMRDVLKALDYVHRQGGIHRDIKAGNILVDKDGCVKLADFGVATSMDRTGSWGHDKNMRMTFVGTPCWMAPEVMEQTAGYDNAADIWSFGIAMLEMAHGAAPFAKYPPMKVLLMTLQNPPPSLEDKGKKHFSKSMRDVVTRCLQKDPRSRPTAAHLLDHKFFKQARDEEYLAKHLMSELPSLGDRVQRIRQGKAATLGAENERNCARSQEEYKKGVSSWNFDVAALKAAAADLDHDDEPLLPTIREEDVPAAGEEALTVCGPRPPGVAVVVSGNSDLPGHVLPVGSSSSIASSFAAAVENGMAAVNSAQDLSSGHERPLNTESWSAWTCSSPEGSREQSREQSNASLNAALSAVSSGAVKQAARTKGRFSVYSESDPVPPMSPSAPSQIPSLAAEQIPESTLGLGWNALAALPPLPSSRLASEASTPLLSPTSSMPVPAAGPGPLPAPTPAAAAQQALALALAREAEPSGSITLRRSDDGLKRDDKGAVDAVAPAGASSAPSFANMAAAPTAAPSAASVATTSAAPAPGPGADGEAKKKGRFTVIENNAVVAAGSVPLPVPVPAAGLERKPSHQSFLDTHHMAASSSSAALLGRQGGAGGHVPATAVLPRLQELLDHTVQHQAALSKLLAAVKESEAAGGTGAGKAVPALLQPARHLFEPSSGGAASGTGGLTPADAEAIEELRHTVRTLQSRLSHAEAENARLRARNTALEASQGSAPMSRKSSKREVSDAELANGPVPSPLLSPRSARSPRISEEGAHT